MRLAIPFFQHLYMHEKREHNEPGRKYGGHQLETRINKMSRGMGASLGLREKQGHTGPNSEMGYMVCAKGKTVNDKMDTHSWYQGRCMVIPDQAVLK